MLVDLNFSSIEFNCLLSMCFEYFQRFSLSISSVNETYRYLTSKFTPTRKLLLWQTLSNTTYEIRSRTKI